MRIGLLRHGQTDWNLQGLLQGHADIPLNDTGRAQARDAGERIRDQGFTRVASSPLVRAFETAQIIAHRLGLAEPTIFDDLLERYYGAGEGQPGFAEDGARLIESYAQIEAIEKVRERGMRALDHIVEHYDNTGNVLVVAHGTIIKQMIISLLGGVLLESTRNTALAVIERTENGWVVESFNDQPIDVAIEAGRLLEATQIVH